MLTLRRTIFAAITLSALSITSPSTVFAQQTNGPAQPAQGSAQAPQPCREAAHRQLDFWVGEWEVQGPKGKTAGVSTVQLILNNCVVFENWTGASGYTGKSFNLYDARERKWKQFWVDDRGGMLEFTGEFRDGAMRYEGQSIAQDGRPVTDRLTFFPLAEGRVRQLWEQSPDKGKTWNTVFDGTYIRKKN